jgi:hypothetical protein
MRTDRSAIKADVSNRLIVRAKTPHPDCFAIRSRFIGER